MRTVLAYLIAPVTTPAILGLLQSVHEHTLGFPAKDFFSYLLIGCMTAYPIAWVTGTIALILLRRTKRETLVTYTATAALAGASYGVLVSWSTPITERALLGLIFAALAAPTGTVFHLLRGVGSRAKASPATTGS